MAREAKVRAALFAVATACSTTNAFMPLENNAKIGCSISTIGRRRFLSGRRGYSNNNIDDNKNKDYDLAPEPVDPSASSDKIEFLFNDESAILNDIALPPFGLEVESLQSDELLGVNAQAIFAENAAILSSGGDQTIDLGFDLEIDNNPIQVRDSTEAVPINEDLRAVLAASGEAAAAAEASMPAELVEVLDELAIEALNETNLNANNVAESTGKVVSPEVVPTLATITPIIPANQEQHVVETSMMALGQERTSLTDDSDINLFESSNNINDGKSVGISAPSVGKILKFAIPAIGVWLCGPILSLIDTSAVGVLSGTIQQAALNPAVAVTDYAALLIAFLYTGTTNMIASAQESDLGTIDMPRTTKMMLGAMRMSTYVGTGLGAFLFVFARPLLRGIIGNDGISPAVFAAAMKYVRIRSLGMPAAAILGSTQAACLGMKDIKSPLYVLGAAALINLLGDILFVGHSNALIGGTAGAAWATVLSQYAAVAFFVRWLCDNGKKETSDKPQEAVNLSDAILEMTSKSDINNTNGKIRRRSFRNVLESFKSNGRKGNATLTIRPKSENFPKNGRKHLGSFTFRRESATTATSNSATKANCDDDSFSTRGFLKNRFSVIDLFKLPDEETRGKFAPYVLPVTTTQVGRVSGYVAMAHVVASSLGTVSMAAQQVIVSIFYCLCPIADSLSLTAQSFVPAISAKEASIEKAAAMKLILVNFLKAGAVFGGAMMSAVCGIPLLTGFFTSDQVVINLVNSVVPLLLVFFGVHGFVCGTEGILLGQKDLGFVGKMYASFFAAVPYIMLGVKKKALAGSKSVGLKSVWTIFVGYQLARCGLWLMRSVLLQRRTNIEGKQAFVSKMSTRAP